MTKAPSVNGDRLGRQVRTALLKDLKSALSGVETVVVARVERVSAKELNQLRYSLQNLQASLLMVKNSLCRRAFRELGWPDLLATLVGTCGVSPIRGDLSSVCKLFTTFSKGHEGFVLQGGILKGKILQGKELALLAELPPKEVLLSRLVGSIQAPAAGFMGVVQGLQRKLVGILVSITSKKGG